MTTLSSFLPVELGDHVGLRIIHHGDGRGRADLGKRLAGSEARADNRDADRRGDGAGRRRGSDVRERDAAVGRVALIEEDDCGRARGLGVRDLEGEAAAAPLDQRDPAGDEAREVVDPARVSRERRPNCCFREGSVAPARVRARGRQVDVDGRDLVVTVPRALPVTPPDGCVVAGIGVCCWIGCATVKSNSWVATDQPAASSVSIT